MRRFSGQDSIDPDDPELDYSPLSLSERALKLGSSASQAARSEPIGVVPLSRPTSLVPKAIKEPARRSRDSDRRAAMLSVATRVASVAGAAAIVVLLFFIMKPAPLQSVSSSTQSETTGSMPQFNPGNVESKPALAEANALPASLPSELVTQEQSEQLLQRFLQSSSIRSDTTGSTPQSKNGDEKSNPTLAELKTLLASPSTDPATQERSQQLLQRFLQWSEKVDTTEAPVSSAQRR
jgi:hypothetical protein